MFDSIFYNGEEYKQIWLDGVLVWEKDDGGIVYPYDDCDTYYTFYRYTRSDNKTITFEIIDETLPYSVNGVETNTYTFTTNNTVKLINLKPYRPFENYYYYYDGSTIYNYYTTNMYQMRLPNLTDLSYLFYQAWDKDGLKTNYDKSNNWQLEYIEWHPRPTNMSYFLCGCSGMTNTHLEKLLPYFPNTKYVKNMSCMFSNCGQLTSMDFLLDWEVENVEDMSYMFEMNYNDGCSFTEIDLSNFRTHNVKNMSYMFYYCKSCKVFDLRNFDTRNVTNYTWMFSNVSDATIYISDKWTLGTSATFGNGTNLTFVLVDIEHPITSIDLKCDFDANNVTQQILTIEPNIYPKNWSVGDLEVIYDTTYLRSDNDRTFYLKDGCQGKTFDITYRSKTDNSISKTVTINVNIPNNVLLYPYPEADSAFTVRNTSTSSSRVSFDVIDSSLPYSINGIVGRDYYSIPASSEMTVKLVNLKPSSSTFSSSKFPTKIEQLRIPNVTDLSYLFRYFGYDANYEYSWSPQYFEFSDSVRNMSYMFYYCRYLTDELMEQFIPYLPNASNVTRMYYMFYNCITLTKLDLSTLNVSSVLKDMGFMFQYCSALKELNLSSFDTTNIPSETYSSGACIFDSVKDCTIYVNENKWTLGTDSSLRKGTNLTFVVVDDNGEVVSRPTGLLADFTKTGVVQLPVWMDEETKNSSYYYKHGTYEYDSTVYGLVENTYPSSIQTFWTCYKVVAPSSTMKITFRAYTYSSSYPFTIHLTSDATQPSYSSSTNRLISATSSTYRDTDGIVETEVVAGETYYIHFQHRLYYSSYSSSDYDYGTCIRSIEFLPLIESIDLSYDVDLSNIEQQAFTVSPIIEPTNYDVKDLEIVYDSSYMYINPTTFGITLLNGSQGMSHTITYRSKADNSISKSITFYVNENLEINDVIDFTQSTAPTLPSYMIVDKNNTYSFNHGTYTTDVYGLIPSNKGVNSSTAYTRYKYVAPKSGNLTFTYRCSSESGYDLFTIHVDTSTSQPSYSSSTNRVLSASGTTYASTDGTANVSVVEGTTYYIHVQYYKDSSQASGYDMGCIRKIELE